MQSDFGLRWRGTRPVVTLCILGGCIAGFVFELVLPAGELPEAVLSLGVVPAGVVAYFQRVPGATFVTSLLPFFSSLFLHGGFLHLLGNVFFLWMSGDVVEAWLGGVRFAVLFLFGSACELIVRLGMSTTPSGLPSVGIGGGLAALIGGYVVVLVRLRGPQDLDSARSRLLRRLPLVLAVLTWFPLQMLNDRGSLVATCQTAEAVPWGGLVASFALGVFLVVLSGPHVRTRRGPGGPQSSAPTPGEPVVELPPGDGAV